MGVSIIVDSGSDILPEDAKKLGVKVIPLKTYFGETEYLDGQTLGHQEFFQKLQEAKKLPTTSQISPAEYEDAYKEADGEVVVITISSKLSGCYQSACIAANEVQKKVCVVDSENACIGERLVVEEAVRMRDKGMNAREIAEYLNFAKKEVCLIALLDTLEYLKKGGRISPAVAFAGNVLSIKPVITIKEGEIQVLGKARGSKMGNNRLIEYVKTCGGIDFDRPFCLAYSGLSKDMLEQYIHDSRELYPMEPGDLPVSSIGCAVGTHIGPGAIAAAFFAGK